MEIFQQEPNWMVRTLAGFLLGYFFTYIIKAVNYLFRHVFTRHYLTGDWYSYFRAWENDKPVLKREKWTIGFGFNSKLKVRIVTDGTLSYDGELSEEKGHLIVKLKAKEYDESVFGRYPVPVPGNDSTVVGLFLAVDYNRHVSAGANILSRVDLSDDQVTALISENTEVDTANGMIRLKH